MFRDHRHPIRRLCSEFQNTEHRTVGLNFFVRAREPPEKITLFPDYESSDGRTGGLQKTLVFTNRRTREYELWNLIMNFTIHRAL